MSLRLYPDSLWRDFRKHLKSDFYQILIILHRIAIDFLKTLCYNIYRKRKFLPCSGNYSFYNPTHNPREFGSVCGLQTSRTAEEGSEKHKGVYPPASCGFYALYDGKADFFTQNTVLINKISRKRYYIAFGILFLWFCFDHKSFNQTFLTVDVSLI